MENRQISPPDNKFLYRHWYSSTPWLESFERHAHNDYELLFIIQGDVDYSIEAATFPVHMGDLVTIKPLSYHIPRFPRKNPYERINITLNHSFYNTPTINGIFRENGKSNLLGNPFIYQWVRRMDAVIETYADGDREKAAEILIDEFVFWLKYNFALPKEPDIDINNAVLENAISYINSHLDTVNGPLDVAQATFVSEPYLFYLFKKHLNITPKNFIMQKKMLMAERLIESGEKFREVSQKLGYTNYSTFFRAYKKYFGKAPSN